MFHVIQKVRDDESGKWVTLVWLTTRSAEHATKHAAWLKSQGWDVKVK